MFEKTTHLISKVEADFPLFQIDVANASDEDLVSLSKESETGLSLDEMRVVREHFRNSGRKMTDVELQALGQAWSEHCCYKSSKTILKEFVFGIDNDDVIDRGDAGVMNFDDDHAYALRIESHNHPSAIEPYGGAATGIGGIVRDVLCMGCQPIALIDPLYFGPLDYDYSKLPQGVKHPKYLLDGVVRGISDYGNRIGIPTLTGGVYFDDSYMGNCLVNVGCVGIAKKDDLYENKAGNAGDLLVYVGGQTGRDGIHGVNFASAELHETSQDDSRGAVQLGDPITKEPVIHSVLEVARQKLMTGMKDVGGGGLSCVVGELAFAGGFGAEAHLDRVPLKEEGLSPWEIWVSESQERMVLAVKEENIDAVLEIFDMYDVTATVIGKVIPEERVKVYYNETKILDLDLNFFTSGPEYCRAFTAEFPVNRREENVPAGQDDYGSTLIKLLSDPNIASKEWVIRQYDHEVRAATVLKPLQGKIAHPTHGDATVLKPLEDSFQGLALTTATNPWACAIDPYRGGLLVMDEMCRSLAAVGATPHSLTNCMNFGNPEKPERLGEFREVVRGIAEAAEFLDLPIPSGNVSFYNETANGPVLPTPSILGAGIVSDIRSTCTADMKSEGNSLYLVGKTAPEMGGSHYYRVEGAYSKDVPLVDPEHLQKMTSAMVSSVESFLAESVHDISDGGLAVALAEMCIGGTIGADVELQDELRSDVLIFSESPTRWLVEVKPENEEAFKEQFQGLPIQKIGQTGGDSLKISAGGKTVVNVTLAAVEKAWRNTITDAMGGGVS